MSKKIILVILLCVMVAGTAWGELTSASMDMSVPIYRGCEEEHPHKLPLIWDAAPPAELSPLPPGEYIPPPYEYHIWENGWWVEKYRKFIKWWNE